MKIGFLYRFPNLPPNSFLENLTSWIDVKTTNILIGDFNLNALCYDSYTPKQRLINYKLLISEPTHMDRVLLDHVYIARSFSIDKKCLFF